VVAELNLKKEVLFEGFKSGLELKKIIKKAKLIVLPSVWYDNSPLVISEAQLLKKPVVISDKGGSKEMIIDKKTGLVFEGGKVDDLAEKLKEILKMSISERNKMGELGRENIIKINNDENYYQNLMKIYKEAINK
jgi:glycosyltransferase involved in cell wall biosynthesis